ncbi:MULTISPECIES: primosomal protein DnaT [Tatumella]|uniref:Replication restart protein DnaT n=1 Tax=Tatumella punctata TaxID=399969 RepID=A0ABW1VNC2_9GAMM|nr:MULTISPECIES: primosomal protein DnaT [unclassified Tatumella]MBS0855638.1 primosomal protein DnaT [Tatumella sp. JGM16]MBS0876618.1 primosomal protein DnaT [Tatumella sp. JGM82]MBS0889995.1 primosomal protein DnaT [Tatumella sp. JGM94]MBS0893143.1 primosomal protein DnaT [Tatumella sp. JGM130]MBS0901239.1 primosomal protein DnaT [Tatumella sp. JGM100]
MPVKILASSIIGLDEFSQDPVSALQSAGQGTLAVFNQNAPVMYALTAERLAELLAAETALQRPADIVLDEQFFDPQAASPAALRIPAGKFPMFAGWQPDKDFQRQAALWGIALSEPVTDEELASFVAYWQAEGRVFHHVQWQQKLARSLQTGRVTKYSQGRRDLTGVAEPDRQTPNGFRGE